MSNHNLSPSQPQTPKIVEPKMKPKVGVMLGTLLGIIFVTVLVGIGAYFVGKNAGTKDAKKTTKNITTQTSEIAVNKTTNKIYFYKSMLNQPNDRVGLWEYDLETKEEKQLVSFYKLSLNKKTEEKDHLDVYFDPVANSTKDKIAYLVTWTKRILDENETSETLEYDLYVYDVAKNENTKVTSDLVLMESYTHPPEWATDGSIYLVITDDDNYDQIYKFSLDGQKEKVIADYDGNTYWPKLLDDFIVYTPSASVTSFPDSKDLGVYDVKNKKNYLFETVSTNYYFSVYSNSPTEVIKVNKGSLSSDGSSYDEGVYGAEILNLEDESVSVFPTPSGIDMSEDTKRIQTLVHCNDYILMGRVLENEEALFNESIEDYLLYNIKSEEVTTLEDNSLSGEESVFQCYKTTDKIFWIKDSTRYDLDLKTLEVEEVKYNPKALETKVEYEQCFRSEVRFLDSKHQIVEMIQDVITSQEDFEKCKSEPGDYWGLYLYDETNEEFKQFHVNEDEDENNFVLTVT